ncbi:seminase-like [Eurosta solidaginis]|uniref:seminase-like n=1 Tax=Eurosta solidaginis TaxID=178769 RepID=UPI0035311E98
MNLHINFELLLVVLLFGFTYTSSRFRIVKGSLADIKKMPYIVALIYDDCEHAFCGGSLVTMQIVVTAAHCLVKRAPNRITVIAGVDNLMITTTSSKVESTFHSCSFNPKTLQMDIGAVKLRTPFKESPWVQAIPLCNIDLKPGTEMHVSGWGSTNPYEEDYQLLLRTTVRPITTEEICKTRFSFENQPIYKSMMCASNEGSGPCYGDSGGPGVVDGQLCGVVSLTWGDCATYFYPTIYINVTYIGVQRFIQNVIKC